MERTHERAAIIAIGDELAIGQSLDTNSRWLASRLTSLGVNVIEHVTVADDARAMLAAFERLALVNDLIIATGGLGPTADDLSRDVLATLLGETLVRDEHAHRTLEALFRKRGRELTDANAMQAMRPISAQCLANDHGTAPGLHTTLKRAGRVTDLFILPGPPHENQPMFDRFVAPIVQIRSGHVIRTRVIHHYGPAESEAARRLGSVLARDRNPLVGITASDGVISLRIRYQGTERDATRLLEETDADAARVLADHRFAVVDHQNPEDSHSPLYPALLDALNQTHGALVTAESCTGGMLAQHITAIAGSSSVFIGGWVTYANAMKSATLGVPNEFFNDPTIDITDRPGVVSAETARAMALGALLRTPDHAIKSCRAKVVHSLAITGIAGPGGASPGKPVGTVWIARASAPAGDRDNATVDVRRLLFPGDRDTIRRRSCATATAMLLFHVMNRPLERVLWQMSADGSAIRT